WRGFRSGSVWPDTSNLRFGTPAAFSFFLASTRELARFLSFLSQPAMSSSLSVLNEHWFLRPSSRRRVLTSFSTLPEAALPTAFLATSHGFCRKATTTTAIRAFIAHLQILERAYFNPAAAGGTRFQRRGRRSGR